MPKAKSKRVRRETEGPITELSENVMEQLAERVFQKMEKHLGPKDKASTSKEKNGPQQIEAANSAIQAILGERGADEQAQGPNPLGVHVSPKLKDRIFNDKFVELSALLPQATGASSDEEEEEHRTGGQRSKKALKLNIGDFMEAFHILIAIRVEKFPQDAAGMLKHIATVQGLNKLFGTESWQFYDRQFRLAKQHAKNMAWGAPDTEIYMQAVGVGYKQKMTKQPFRGQSSQAKPGNSLRPNTCWAFQQSGRCKPSCRFASTHCCYKCRGPHPTSECGTSHFQQAKRFAPHK